MPYNLDKPVTEYSISQLLALYNDICRYNGVSGRNSTFRDKASAVKAVNGALVQANTVVDESTDLGPEDEAPARSPGLARLRSSPLADALRESVLADQAAAAEVATDLHDATEIARDSRAAAPDTTVANPPVAKRGRSSSLTGNEVITVLAKENPKRAGSTAHDWFSRYKDGMTVDEYGAACRNRAKAIRHVMWDKAHGFIRLD